MDPEFLALLACPLEDSRPPFDFRDGMLVCTSCGAKFPVVDGIPRLLPEDAIVEDAGVSRK